MPPNSRMVAGSLKEVASILGKSGKNFGKSTKEVVDNQFIKGSGSGSMVLDAVKWPVKNTKLGKNIDKGIHNVQRKLTDADMAAGKKIVDKLSKKPDSKIRNSIADKFVQNHQFKAKRVDGKPQEIVEVSTAGLTAPLSKAKDTVLPIAGALTISNALMGSGEDKGGEAMKKNASKREELIKKIAAAVAEKDSLNKVASKSPTVEKTGINKEALDNALSLCKKASMLLKASAVNGKAQSMRINELAICNEKLAIENQRLILEKESRERKEDAEKLAHKMLTKGLLKKADLSTRIAEYEAMDKEAFHMLQEAVEGVEKVAESLPEGVDSLAYIADSVSLGGQKPRGSLADEINNISM